MAHITETDYKKMAEAVSGDLINGNIPLNESISKLASSMQMNQEQVRRLCEASNNTTFNRLFQARDKTAEDRMVEFDVANADKILSESVKEASWILVDGETISLSEYRSLAKIEPDPETDTVKTAFELRPESKPSTEKDRRTLQKTLDYLRHEKLAAAYAYSDVVSSLRTQFKRLYQSTSFDVFEKEAAALHKTNAVQPLTDLRAQLRLPAVSYNFEQLQKHAGYIDDSKQELKLFAEAVTYANKLKELNNGISKLETLV